MMLRELLRNMLWNRAMNEDIDDERCVACDSADVEVLGARAYRCRVCGYEGGSGLAEAQDEQRRAQWRSWPAERRIASAREDLLEARRLCLSSEGGVGSAHAASRLDLVGLGGGGGYDAQDEGQLALAGALGQLAEARRLFEDACSKVDDPGVASALPDADLGLWSADIHMDGLLSDLMMLQHIDDVTRATGELAGQVEQALASLGGASGE